MFTDFGVQGPYLGQLEAAVLERAKEVKIVNLLSDAPRVNPRSSAYLLAALATRLPADSVFLCVVDPGVGGSRLPVVLKADCRWFVGPENGLLNTVAVHAHTCQWSVIQWQPQNLSASFHGRDLFAPVVARIAIGDPDAGIRPFDGPDLNGWPDDIDEIVYIDHYGNAITGRRWSQDLEDRVIHINGVTIRQARTFTCVPKGQVFWYENSCGLIEIAVNRGSADRLLGLTVGSVFCLRDSQ